MSLTLEGYHRPTYEEILNNKINKAKQIFGEDIRTDETSVMGKIIRMDAYDLSKAYEDIEAAYYARFVNTSIGGTSLDHLGVATSVTRNPATYSTRTVRITGTAGTTTNDILVSGKDREVIFHNLQSFTISENGYVDILVECGTAGTAGNVYVIDNIVNPIAGVDSVTYIGSDDDVDGKEIESDYEFRKRMQIANISGGCNTDAITSALLRVTGVISAGVVENEENTEVDGRPPNSFECYVYGGEGHEQEIAEAIFLKKAPGIKTCTTVDPIPDNMPVQVTDISGTVHDIYFTFAGEIKVYIKIQYTKNNTFETDGETQIKNALVEYINNLGIGQSVILSKLYEHIHSVTGVTDVPLLQLSSNGVDYSASNITVNTWAVAETTPDLIELEVI